MLPGPEHLFHVFLHRGLPFVVLFQRWGLGYLRNESSLEIWVRCLLELGVALGRHPIQWRSGGFVTGDPRLDFQY